MEPTCHLPAGHADPPRPAAARLREPGSAVSRNAVKRIALVAAVSMVALTACHAPPHASSHAPLRGCPQAANRTPDVPATSPEPRQSIDPNFDNGQEILITGHTFIPHWLVSIVDEDIVWWNQTSRVQRIR